MFFRVGNCQRVSFVKDNWCRDVPFCGMFHELFAVFDNKELQVADVWKIYVFGGGVVVESGLY